MKMISLKLDSLSLLFLSASADGNCFMNRGNRIKIFFLQIPKVNMAFGLRALSLAFSRLSAATTWHARE